MGRRRRMALRQRRRQRRRRQQRRPRLRPQLRRLPSRWRRRLLSSTRCAQRALAHSVCAELACCDELASLKCFPKCGDRLAAAG